MPTSLTAEQILALAPDASSAKSGKDLASPRKWVSLGQSEAAAWGECQGSGKLPYQVKIDLSGTSMQCSCPSRKQPCKHGLGLFLLLASQPAALTQGEPPSWVAEWLEARAQRAEKKAEKEAKAAPKEEGAAPSMDTKAQAKRSAERLAKVNAGLQELEIWLRDLVRRGLAAVQREPYRFWEAPAARLVDAQAPGVARLVKDMASIPSSGEGWQDRLLERLGRLHLLLEGFKRLESLSPTVQADIRSLVGWTFSQEELLKEPGVHDHWLVLGQSVEEEDNLRVQRTWLWGAETSRAALVLNFAAFRQSLDISLAPGSSLDADLVFFPGSYLLRALVKTRHRPPAPLESLPGYPDIASASKAYSSALGLNPWLDRFPMPLRQVIPVQQSGRRLLRDSEGYILPLQPRFERSWQLLALSGGYPLDLFGEWDGDHLLPLSAWSEGRLLAW